jgi:hypothetical protein
MLPKSELAPWLKSVMLVGYEDQDPQGGTGTEGDPGDGDPTDGDPSPEPDNDGLKKALAAERLRNKNLEKRLRDATASKGATGDDDEEPSDEPQESEKGKGKSSRSPAARAAEEKLQRVTAAFVKSSFRSTVRDLATNFVDPDDAVAALDMSLINHEQDEDDPSNIVWDESEIKTALKDLAKRKPHFLKAADAGNGAQTPRRPSGSKFGGAGKPSTQQTPQQKLDDYQRRFPAFRGVVAPPK